MTHPQLQIVSNFKREKDAFALMSASENKVERNAVRRPLSREIVFRRHYDEDIGEKLTGTSAIEINKSIHLKKKNNTSVFVKQKEFFFHVDFFFLLPVFFLLYEYKNTQNKTLNW